MMNIYRTEHFIFYQKAFQKVILQDELKTSVPFYKHAQSKLLANRY